MYPTVAPALFLLAPTPSPFLLSILIMTMTTVTKTRKARTSPMIRVRSDEEGPFADGSGEAGVVETTSVPYKTMEFRPAAKKDKTNNGNANCITDADHLRLHIPPVQFFVARSFPPTQYRPPFLGCGLLHSLLLKWRQSGPHDDHDVHEDQFPSTAGQTALHAFFCTGAPSQPGPSLTGAGESHFRVRLRAPRPHATLHDDHEDHEDHFPGTENRWETGMSIQIFSPMNACACARQRVRKSAR